MQQNTKLIMVGLLCFALGAGGFFAYSQYTQTQRENADLKAQLTATPQASFKPTASPSMAPATSSQPEAKNEVTAQTSGITGSLGYPAGGIPPLEVYAFKQGDMSVFFKITTKTNQQNFTITDVPTGTYVVVAYPQDTGALSGGYTKAVACGLSVECTDHSLVPVVVTTGTTTSDVAVKDWYAPEGTFPKKPGI